MAENEGIPARKIWDDLVDRVIRGGRRAGLSERIIIGDMQEIRIHDYASMENLLEKYNRIANQKR